MVRQRFEGRCLNNWRRIQRPLAESGVRSSQRRFSDVGASHTGNAAFLLRSVAY
jgi:hypothetical protein